jgi:meso-butanediol dehydrogenase / (S,S)-butanediol dehydrogenase / diacetyl reductase
MRLAGKVAVITGAASGIGAATARLFAREGARLMLGDLDEAGVRRVAEECSGEGGEANALRTDVTTGADVRRLVDGAAERYGKLDIIFNNAGIGMPGSILDRDEDDFDRVIAVNLKGVYLGCKYALPHFLNNPTGGAIVNMSSNGGLIGRPADPLYVATKHGVMGLTKSLALAYADRRIRVNAVCPGPIDTPMIWEGMPPGMERDEFIRRAVAACPTLRMAAPDEVANAALFLASDEASFVSGVGLAVDGAKAAGVFPANRYRLDFDLLS